MKTETITVNGTEFILTIKDGRTHGVSIGSISLFSSEEYGVTMNRQDTILFIGNY